MPFTNILLLFTFVYEILYDNFIINILFIYYDIL